MPWCPNCKSEYKDGILKCPDCDCEFSYVKKDIKESWVRVTSEDSDLTYTYINCPECGKTIIIKDFRNK